MSNLRIIPQKLLSLNTNLNWGTFRLKIKKKINYNKLSTRKACINLTHKQIHLRLFSRKWRLNSLVSFPFGDKIIKTLCQITSFLSKTGNLTNFVNLVRTIGAIVYGFCFCLFPETVNQDRRKRWKSVRSLPNIRSHPFLSFQLYPFQLICPLGLRQDDFIQTF